MPYRGLEHAGPACFRHASAPASETCARCLQPICEIRVAFAATQPHCPICARKARRRHAIRRTAGVMVTTATAAFVMSAVVWIVTRDKPYDYGVHKLQVVALKRALEKEPCDRARIVQLGETMLTAGDPRGALERASAFFQRCGAYPRLLWVTYAAHERLSEHDAAILDATLLIHDNSGYKDYWWWRALAYEAKGDLRGAVDDYEQSLAVEPRLMAIPFNLANVYERLERPCDARRVLQNFLRHHGDLDGRERVEQRIGRLSDQCAPVDPVAPYAAERVLKRLGPWRCRISDIKKENNPNIEKGEPLMPAAEKELEQPKRGMPGGDDPTQKGFERHDDFEKQGSPEDKGYTRK